jgi:hypothetical protein
VFCLRFPIGWIDLEKIAPYEVEGVLEVSTTPSHLILSFTLDTEPDDYDEDEEIDGLLTSLLPIRRALAAGDFRALYIGWLAGLQNGLIERERVEPPVPAGLGDTDEALDHLIEFLNLPEDLVAAAARKSLPLSPAPGKEEMLKWLAGIGTAEKDSWLACVLLDNDPLIACNILNRYRASTSLAETGSHADCWRPSRRSGEARNAPPRS